MESVGLRLMKRSHAREAEEWGYYKGGRLWLSRYFFGMEVCVVVWG